ncbi:MAG TPA: tRNA-uridine aminocarboxypropyltransferase [Stellaceae bacterium]|nr:tRNA-uridine aminocarboxypropyltransferase [Stellaceae bacterium]
MPDPAEESCPRCGKPAALCVCAGIEPIDNRIAVLILQHPQEQDVALGTARLTALQLRNATLKIGLSWPNLGKVLGRPVDPKRWAVLYLGSAKPAELARGREILLLDRKGEPIAGQAEALAEIEGVIVLDGSWSQVKALWWRNAWLLKCRRIVLASRRPSRYGKLRREPRREGLSTLEAVALLLSRLEDRPEIERALIASFETLLERYRNRRRAPPQPPSAASSGPSSPP